MPERFHRRIKASLRKAHPNWSEATLESKTNATMATIAKHSRHKGTYPGPRRGRTGGRIRGSGRRKKS